MSSDEEQEYERFDVDNDFEGGEFIGGEFYYLNKRQKRQQTAEDRIYGIFAESGTACRWRRPQGGVPESPAADRAVRRAFPAAQRGAGVFARGADVRGLPHCRR